MKRNLLKSAVVLAVAVAAASTVLAGPTRPYEAPQASAPRCAHEITTTKSLGVNAKTNTPTRVIVATQFRGCSGMDAGVCTSSAPVCASMKKG